MSDTLRIEYADKPSRDIRVCQCLYTGCTKEVRIRRDYKNHSGMCQAHSHRKRPFESIYNCLKNDWRNIDVTLTYEEFLEFTKISFCTYCKERIPWEPFSIDNGKFISRAYFLDRKNNLQGYSKDNCVVCCSTCNRLRSNILTHEEMIVAMKAVLEYRATKGGTCGA